MEVFRKTLISLTLLDNLASTNWLLSDLYHHCRELSLEHTIFASQVKLCHTWTNNERCKTFLIHLVGCQTPRICMIHSVITSSPAGVSKHHSADNDCVWLL